MNFFQSHIFRFSSSYFISDADQPTSIDGDQEDPVVAQAFDVWRHMIKPMGLVPIYGGIGPFWVSNQTLNHFEYTLFTKCVPLLGVAFWSTQPWAQLEAQCGVQTASRHVPGHYRLNPDTREATGWTQWAVPLIGLFDWSSPCAGSSSLFSLRSLAMGLI